MDAEQFPPFEQSHWYRDLVALDVAGLFESEEQRADCLRMARGLYDRVRKRQETERRQARGDDVGLVS